MACILIELYTGELFFDTHENNEHLAMIEKQCGPIPKWMADKSKASKIAKYLITASKEEGVVERTGKRLRWPQAAQKAESIKHVEDMLLIDDIIKDDSGIDK